MRRRLSEQVEGRPLIHTTQNHPVLHQGPQGRQKRPEAMHRVTCASRYDDDERYPHMIAQKPFGRITIANADAAAKPNIEGAVEQAHRAVTELLSL